MKIRRILTAALLLGALVVSGSFAGNQEIRRYQLFFGNIDSTAQASKWIPTRGARRIMLRTYTSHAVWTSAGAGDVDSTTTDSIASFSVLFSDSVSFLGRDSLGTLVTARSTMSTTGAYPICADSSMVTITNVSAANAAVDTLKGMVVLRAPVYRPLRAPATGSGRYTYVVPQDATSPNVTAADYYPEPVVNSQYMRVRLTPLRRSTAGSWNATVPNRVNGMKGLYMEAIVVYGNQ